MGLLDTNRIIVPPDFKPEVVYDLNEEVYHADPSAVSSSSIRLAVNSPRAFYWGFYKGREKPPTKEMNLGKVIHMAILEPQKFKENFIIQPEFWGKTAKGDLTNNANCTEVKQAKAKWLSDVPPTAVVVTEDQLEMIIGIKDSILDHPDAANCFKNGKAEVSGYYRDEKTGIKIKWRSDFLSNNGVLLNDLKTARTSKRHKFGSQSFEMRHDIQLVTYREGSKAIHGKYPELNTITVVEKTWPYEVAVYYFTPEDLFAAEHDYRKGLDLIKEGIDTGNWPMRQKGIERIYMPTWFLNESVEYEENNEPSDEAASYCEHGGVS